MTFVPTSPRAAYAGELVLGSSGSGKTRNFLKPNLLQCAGSYIPMRCAGKFSSFPNLPALGVIYALKTYLSMRSKAS